MAQAASSATEPVPHALRHTWLSRWHGPCFRWSPDSEPRRISVLIRPPAASVLHRRVSAWLLLLRSSKRSPACWPPAWPLRPRNAPSARRSGLAPPPVAPVPWPDRFPLPPTLVRTCTARDPAPSSSCRIRLQRRPALLQYLRKRF